MRGPDDAPGSIQTPTVDPGWRHLMTEEQEGRVAIRTPDQRLRVFVSSTLVELADERAVVARAISALGLTPVLFELGARPHPPRELYRAYLAQSDIFVGLYWQRYGWIGPDMEISGLEDEFRLSRSIPRLLYVKAPAPEREPRAGSDDRGAPDRGERLLPVLRHSTGARTAGPGRSRPAPERGVHEARHPRRSHPLGSVRGRRACAAIAAHDVDVADRARARDRRGRRAAAVTRGALGHPHRPRRHRQDAARDRSR